MIEFRSLADDEPALSFSPLLRGVLKTFAYVQEHGSIGLTPSKAFKRNFVHWAAAEFDWPGHSEADLFAVNKVLNEHDFMPLGDIHFLLTTLKMGRHYKGNFKLTKSGAELAHQPGRLFGIITPFYLFEIDHSGCPAEYLATPHNHAAFGCLCSHREQTNTPQLRRSSISPTY